MARCRRGVTVAPNGRIFVNFPQWGDNAPFTVAELVDGKAVPYPDAATNQPDPADPAGHFISVQSVVADERGNLVFRKTARNFNPMMATAGKITVVEVEEIVPVGSLDPDHIHTPGVYVDRLVQTVSEKRIEQRTVRQRAAGAAAGSEV